MHLQVEDTGRGSAENGFTDGFVGEAQDVEPLPGCVQPSPSSGIHTCKLTLPFPTFTKYGSNSLV